MADLHHIWSHFSWQDVGVLFIILSALAAHVYRSGKQAGRINELEEAIAEIHETIEEFHGKCDTVTGELGMALTKEDLEAHCDKSQAKCTSAICRKIEAIHVRISDQATSVQAIEIKVDHQQEVLNTQLGEILKSVGRLEGLMEAKG